MHINDKNIYYYDSMSNNSENHSRSLMRCLKNKWITNHGTKKADWNDWDPIGRTSDVPIQPIGKQYGH